MKEEVEKIIQEFFLNMNFPINKIEIKISSLKDFLLNEKEKKETEEIKPVIVLDIKVDEPKLLVGHKGQTLQEIQYLLRLILQKKLNKSFYLDFDINNYKKRKIEYLKKLTKEIADEVALTKREEALPPMPSFERRIVHICIAQRTDVVSESQDEGERRHVVIKPRWFF